MDNFSNITHLAIGAHQDDIEVMAAHGLFECQELEANRFGGIICTSGAGSARSGKFEKLSDEEMARVRANEQEKVANAANYSALAQLGFASSSLKSEWNDALVDQLIEKIQEAKPDVIYTHNPADKHQTHVGVVAHVIKALRKSTHRPQKLFGCEVWRNLDWLSDGEKIPLPIKDPQQVGQWIAMYESQVAGGKRYDLATQGRMLANATFFESHTVDACSAQVFAMNLMPLLDDPDLTLAGFVSQKINKFADEVDQALKGFN